MIFISNKNSVLNKEADKKGRSVRFHRMLMQAITQIRIQSAKSLSQQKYSKRYVITFKNFQMINEALEKENFAEEIKYAIDVLPISQSRLADLTGVCRTTINRIISGKEVCSFERGVVIITVLSELLCQKGLPLPFPVPIPPKYDALYAREEPSEEDAKL